MSLTSLVSFLGMMALAAVASAAEPETATVAAELGTASVSADGGYAEKAVKRGRYKVGGSAAYSSYRGLAVTPSAEYFLIDRLSLGLETSLWWYQGLNHTRSVSPIVAYYFYANEDFAVSLQQAINFNWSRYRGGNDDGSSWTSARTAIGLDWFVNPYVSISPIIGMKYGDSDWPNSSFATLNLNVFL